MPWVHEKPADLNMCAADLLLFEAAATGGFSRREYRMDNHLSHLNIESATYLMNMSIGTSPHGDCGACAEYTREYCVVSCVLGIQLDQLVVQGVPIYLWIPECTG